MRVRISNETLNCFGTWVKTDGIDLSQFRRNPILLYMHERGKAIGTVENVQVENNEVTGELRFDLVREESRIAKEQFEKGTLKMVSPGFEILEASAAMELRKPGQKMKTVTRCRLNEVSVVDVGGNDDNMVLSHEGKVLNLSAGGECPPLLALDNMNGQNEEKEMKEIALRLGLPETAAAQEITAKLDILLGYKTANEALRTELDQLKQASISQLVDSAVAAGKFTADKKEHFLTLGRTVGAENLKLTLDAMQSVTKPMDLVRPGGGTSAMEGNYKKLGEVPADKLLLIRSEHPEQYKTLYKAEYGIECPPLEE